jgi:4-hydroxy-3-methylbut-2-enyl diphosphate reductase
MTQTIPHPANPRTSTNQRTPRSEPAPLVIYAPMRIEARAIRRGLAASGHPAQVRRTGYGTTRAAQAAGQVSGSPFGPVAVLGVGAGLTADLRPGDLVVGTEVGAATCGSAPLLAAELGRAGRTPARSPPWTISSGAPNAPPWPPRVTC